MKIIVKYEDRGVEIMHEGLGLKKKQFFNRENRGKWGFEQRGLAGKCLK